MWIDMLLKEMIVWEGLPRYVTFSRHYGSFKVQRSFSVKKFTDFTPADAVQSYTVVWLISCGKIQFSRVQRWLRGEECLLCEHEDLSSNSKNPCKKLCVNTFTCDPELWKGRNSKITEACWPPAWLWDPQETLLQRDKMEEDRARCLQSSSGFCKCAHCHIHPHTYAHTLMHTVLVYRHAYTIPKKEWIKKQMPRSLLSPFHITKEKYVLETFLNLPFFSICISLFFSGNIWKRPHLLLQDFCPSCSASVEQSGSLDREWAESFLSSFVLFSFWPKE